MTLPEIAESINGLFRKYGLDHDVVAVRVPTVIHLDPRENEPDPMKWRNVPRLPVDVGSPVSEITFIHGADRDQMDLFLSTLEYIFQEYFAVHPPTDQLRLF